jgi:hypothetical protein
MVAWLSENSVMSPVNELTIALVGDEKMATWYPSASTI